LIPVAFHSVTVSKALLQKAHEAYIQAQELETALNNKPPEERSRAEYLTVIKAYKRVYMITPHTGYADNALIAVARLYDAIQDTAAELKTLNFLVREYPTTPFRGAAEKDIARLQGLPEKKSLGPVSVDNVRYWEGTNSVRVVVDLSAEAEFKQGDAKSPDRVFIDIARARLNAGLAGKPLPVQSGLLQQIRVGQNDPSTVRIVLDVGAIGRVTSFALHDPDRLIIDVLGDSTPVPATALRPTVAVEKTTTPESVPESRKVAAAPVREPMTADAKPEPKQPANEMVIVPAKPASNGDRSLVRSLGLKVQRVVIDPGHGGHDTGTVGPSGYTEKELVLDISKRLKELIEKELGAEVVLTRDDDTFIPLETRTAIANQESGDLFVSIHANSSRVRTVRGVETYYLNLTTSREALDVAARENAASEHSIHELQELSKKILLQDKVEESRELARAIQKGMAGRKNPGMDRGVKHAPFVVLMGANMPSILAEISFISNPQEEKLLKTTDYRQTIAQSLFAGVKSYSESLSGLKTATNREKN